MIEMTTVISVTEMIAGQTAVEAAVPMFRVQHFEISPADHPGDAPKGRWIDGVREDLEAITPTRLVDRPEIIKNCDGTPAEFYTLSEAIAYITAMRGLMHMGGADTRFRVLDQKGEIVHTDTRGVIHAERRHRELGDCPQEQAGDPYAFHEPSVTCPECRDYLRRHPLGATR